VSRRGAAGQGEEDVVEVRRVHGELLGVDAVFVEPVQHAPQRREPPSLGTRRVSSWSSRVEPASTRAAASSS
jgi:hypothetical protein